MFLYFILLFVLWGYILYLSCSLLKYLYLQTCRLPEPYCSPPFVPFAQAAMAAVLASHQGSPNATVGPALAEAFKPKARFELFSLISASPSPLLFSPVELAVPFRVSFFLAP